MTFDANGNLTSITEPGGVTTLTWDARNRLIGLSGPGLTASFQYDAFARRSTRVVNSVSTAFLYDDVTPVQEQSNSTVAANMLTGLELVSILCGATPQVIARSWPMLSLHCNAPRSG